MKYLKNIVFIFILLNTYVTSLPTITDDNNKPTDEMITNEGYPVELHDVTTKDGYILRLHRIPNGKNGESNQKVVLLEHGLLSSSIDWVIFGPGNSLGYILADLGYDVWLGNARGNVYNRNHTTYDPDKDDEFWDFTLHEIGIYDLPITIDYIMNVTGVDGIHYAGHSQGTTSFYVMASEKPEYNEKIKVHISLAPMAYMSHLTSSLVRIMAFYMKSMELLLDLIGAHEFLPNVGFLHMVNEEFCSEGVGPILCQNVLFAIAGFSYSEMDTNKVPLIMGHTPAGAATKQVLHYTQGVDSAKFRQYDYGFVDNWDVYGQINPPQYNLSKVTAPVHLIYSSNDWMAGVEDVDQLSNELGNVIEKKLVAEKTFNHLDFIYGINAPSLVYEDVINIFSKY